ncbi:MAG: Bcr/CflA family efflux MFS transporter [Desulfobulbaceae bacterium]|nr:Bcr/CflA family efflux MFS transporter [Desulfobulbaceae bacterium]
MSSASPHHKRSFVVTLGLLTGLAALTVDVSLPAIPAMVEALATSLQRGQQIVGVFMAGMAVGQIPAGLFADRLGRLPVLYVGMSLFAAGATIAAAANDIEWLLAARFLQGFGAASAIVVSRAIVRDVASGKEAARLMSLMMMIFTAAPVIAPSIGALLVTQWGWRAPFILICACGLAILFAIRNNLVETHTPTAGQHPVRQLISSFTEFFSHRQSIFGLLLIILPPAGFMSIITVSAALVVEIYGFSVQAYGLVFATAGLSILTGAAINRILVARFDMMQLITFGTALIAICGIQLLVIAWLDDAPLWWLWTNICIFMFTVAILMPNSVIVALDPLPRIAGVASSIIGTLQNIFGASGAIVGALIYDGSVRNSVVIIAAVSAVTVTVFLLKPLIAPGPFIHHPDELARD